MKIFIIGYMGSGKSSLGRKLARRLDYAFIDLDDILEAESGMKIVELFSQHGERSFGEQERKALKAVLDLDNTVVATGGGAPCYKDNMDLLLQHGLTIYLRLHPDSLAHRLRQNRRERPVLSRISDRKLSEFIHAQLTEREKYYLRANIIIKGEDLDIQTIINAISWKS